MVVFHTVLVIRGAQNPFDSPEYFEEIQELDNNQQYAPLVPVAYEFEPIVQRPLEGDPLYAIPPINDGPAIRGVSIYPILPDFARDPIIIPLVPYHPFERNVPDHVDYVAEPVEYVTEPVVSGPGIPPMMVDWGRGEPIPHSSFPYIHPDTPVNSIDDNDNWRDQFNEPLDQFNEPLDQFENVPSLRRTGYYH